MAGQVWPERENHIFCETFWILSKTGFLRHTFGSSYARKSIKGSKDADHSLVSIKNLIQINSSLGWRSGPSILSQKIENMSPLWRHPRKSQT